jgi:hypothetical protein
MLRSQVEEGQQQVPMELGIHLIADDEEHRGRTGMGTSS